MQFYRTIQNRISDFLTYLLRNTILGLVGRPTNSMRKRQLCFFLIAKVEESYVSCSRTTSLLRHNRSLINYVSCDSTQAEMHAHGSEVNK